MRTRTIIGLATVVAIGFAAYYENLAAAYVAGGTYVVMYMLHAIEFKINRLLDHYNLSVRDFEIAKD
jgi:hypothetical protein